MVVIVRKSWLYPKGNLRFNRVCTVAYRIGISLEFITDVRRVISTTGIVIMG